MRIALQINQGVPKVILSNPYCQSLYMYALYIIIQAGEQFSVSFKTHNLFLFLYYL